MSYAKSGSEEVQRQGFIEESMQTTTTTAKQPARALDILLDISTNGHPVMESSDVATVSLKSHNGIITLQ